MRKKINPTHFIQFEKPVWKIPLVKEKAYFVRLKGQKKLLKLDEKLNIVFAINLPISTDSENWDISVSPDERHYCLTLENRIELRRLDHQLLFSKEGDFLQTDGTESIFVDKDHLFFFDFKTEGRKHYARLNELKVQTNQIKEGIYFESEDGVYCLFFDKTHQQIIIEVACGQDGILLFKIDPSLITRKAPEEINLGCDKIFSGWHPSQKYFLTSPHNSDILSIYTYPDIQLFKTIEDEKIFTEAFALSEEEHLYFCSAFIGDDYILHVSTCDNLILLKWTEEVYPCYRLISPNFEEKQYGGISYGNVLWTKPVKDGFLVAYANGVLEKYESVIFD